MSSNEQYQNILETYSRATSDLSKDKLGHFFERAYFASGNVAYTSLIFDAFQKSRLQKLKNALLNWNNPEYVYIPTFKKNTSSPNTKRNNKRKEWYQTYPKLPLLHDITNGAFFLKKFHLTQTFRDIYSESKETLTDLMKESERLYSREGILIDSSYSANTLFHLRSLGIVDYTSLYLTAFQEILVTDYANPATLSQEDLYSVFYTLTHIIIAASDFYDRVPAEGFSWIFSYFELHQAIAEKNLSLDILTEVALCYKICGHQVDQNSIYQKYFTHVLHTFALVSKEDTSYLEKTEHTASIALLLFSPTKTFFSGPDLAHLSLEK
ncbi:MAG: DUF3541 domain-containing protein [Patescibacteria group bacterium]